MPMLQPMASHDEKSLIESHFNSVDLRNAYLPLTMPSASHDADVNANGIIWAKRSCCTSFQLSWPKECNHTIDNAISIMWQWHPMTHIMSKWHNVTTLHLISIILTSILVPIALYEQKACCTSLWSHWPNKCNHAIDNAIKSHDANASTKCFTWPKRWCCTSFQLSCPSKCNGTTDYFIGITWCWCWWQWHWHDQNINVSSHFDHLSLKMQWCQW